MQPVIQRLRLNMRQSSKQKHVSSSSRCSISACHRPGIPTGVTGSGRGQRRQEEEMAPCRELISKINVSSHHVQSAFMNLYDIAFLFLNLEPDHGSSSITDCRPESRETPFCLH
uniref:Uncharacterized protein n=1 Tax=Knipowitschia caucasica TaxID=637954 RepID=A0AAV2LCJ0_KNICA